MKEIFRFLEQPEFEEPSLIVAWEDDPGRLGHNVIGFLNKAANGKCFCEMDPVPFFSLGGVTIENDVAGFPASRFYRCGQRKDLVVFESSEPVSKRHEFLSALVDCARHYWSVRELYTIGGTLSPAAHTGLRRILAVFNQREFQERLRGCGLEDMTWEGPPAISSHLLWIARGKGIPGVSLWPEIPFYLATGDDFQAMKLVLSFLDTKFSLGLDLGGLDDKIRNQDEKISQLRREDPDVDKYVSMLESQLSLSREEQTELAEKVARVIQSNG